MPLPDPSLRCNFRASDGKRCRMFREENHPSLCTAHARRTLPGAAARARDVIVLAPPTAAEVQAMMQKVFVWIVARRITSRQGNRLLRCISRAKRGLPFASFELADTWKELCDSAEASLNPVVSEVEPSRSVRLFHSFRRPKKDRNLEPSPC